MTDAGVIVARRVPLAAERTLAQTGVHPLLARLFAARGVRTAGDLDCDLSALLPPSQLKNADAAAALLADHIASGKRLMIVADYDCDGATACAVAVVVRSTISCRTDSRPVTACRRRSWIWSRRRGRT
jgi:single-stranded-DNA-specific exonuclease